MFNPAFIDHDNPLVYKNTGYQFFEGIYHSFGEAPFTNQPGFNPGLHN